MSAFYPKCIYRGGGGGEVGRGGGPPEWIKKRWVKILEAFQVCSFLQDNGESRTQLHAVFANFYLEKANCIRGMGRHSFWLYSLEAHSKKQEWKKRKRTVSNTMQSRDRRHHRTTLFFICVNCNRDCHSRIGLHSHHRRCSTAWRNLSSRETEGGR